MLKLWKTLCAAAFLLSVNAYSSNDTFYFGVISDMNKSYGSITYTSDLDVAINSIIKQKNYSLVLSTGDMVAGQKAGLNYQSMWEAFHNKVTEPLNKNGIAFAPSPGNHDASIGAQFSNERKIYVETFTKKTPSVLLNKVGQKFSKEILLHEGSQFPLYYAFEMKGGLFISIDATATAALSVSQFQFVQEVLSKTKAKFKIIFGHMPLYPFAFSRAHEFMAKKNSSFNEEWEDLLEKHKVDYFLSGHHHVYYPGHRNGYTNYVSVPHLGTGARAILFPGNTKLSKPAFLSFSYNTREGLVMRAIETASLEQIPLSEIPKAVVIPKANASNCIGCASFPNNFFIDQPNRILYLRSDQ